MWSEIMECLSYPVYAHAHNCAIGREGLAGRAAGGQPGAKAVKKVRVTDYVGRINVPTAAVYS